MNLEDFRAGLHKKDKKQLLLDILMIEKMKFDGTLTEESFERIAKGVKINYVNKGNNVKIKKI